MLIKLILKAHKNQISIKFFTTTTGCEGLWQTTGWHFVDYKSRMGCWLLTAGMHWGVVTNPDPAHYNHYINCITGDQEVSQHQHTSQEHFSLKQSIHLLAASAPENTAECSQYHSLFFQFFCIHCQFTFMYSRYLASSIANYQVKSKC